MNQRLKNMNEVGLARKYARALFQAVKEEKKISFSQIRKEMKQILQMFCYEPALEKALLNPLISFEERKKILRQKTKSSSVDFYPLFYNFMDILLKKKRFHLLPLVEMDLENEIEKSEGMLTAFVKSAVALDEKSRKEMETKLSSFFNRKVRVEHEVQTDLLAGVVIRAGDTVIDNSLKSQLNQLKSRLEFHGY